MRELVAGSAAIVRLGIWVSDGWSKPNRGKLPRKLRGLAKAKLESGSGCEKKGPASHPSDVLSLNPGVFRLERFRLNRNYATADRDLAEFQGQRTGTGASPDLR